MKMYCLLFLTLIIYKSNYAQRYMVPDSSFHAMGYAPVYVGGVTSIAIDANNKILAGINQCYGSEYYISKFDENGIVDTVFGNKGEAQYYIGPGSISNDLLIQNDNNIVSAGI